MMGGDPVGNVAAGNDGIAERDTVAIVAGEIKAWSLGFDFGHQFAIFAETDIVLRNGFRVEGDVTENGITFDADDRA